MADFYGSHFEYAGISSRTCGLIFANVETERMLNLYGSISGVTVFSNSAKKRYLIDDSYSNSPITFEIDIIKDDEDYIDRDTRRAIEKWLFNRTTYNKLYLDITDDCDAETYENVNGEVKRLYLNCRFINPEKLEYNGGIVGYRATVEADSNMWWQEAIEKTFTFSNTTSSTVSNFSIDIDTDWNEYTYPDVTITMGSSGGDITLINQTDSSTRLTKFVNVGQSASIILHGDTNYVSADYYSKFYNHNFPRLLDGRNNLSVIGNIASIKFKYQNRRAL